MMKVLLLCLGLTLVCAHPKIYREVVTKNFDIPKLSGVWYTILLTSNVKEAIKENGVFRGILDSVEVMDNSSPELKFHVKRNGKCVTFSLPTNKTSENGVYNISYPGVDRLRLIEVVYDDYIVVHLISDDSEKPLFVVGLFAQTPDASPEIKKKFKRIARKFGIPKKNILDLTKTDRCLQTQENQVAQDTSAK